MKRYRLTPIKILVSACALFTFSVCFGQVELSTEKVNFGRVEKQSDRIVDLTVTNSGSSKATLLRQDLPPDYSFAISSKTIEPGGKVNLRVKFNPRKKGASADKAAFWFSNMSYPLIIEFEAITEFVDTSDNPECPDFSQRPFSSVNQTEVTIMVKDALSGEPLSDALVNVYGNGRQVNKSTTDNSGAVEFRIHPEYFFIAVNKQGYEPADTSLYLNKKSNLTVIYLPRNPMPDLSEEITLNRPTEVIASEQMWPEFDENSYLPNHIVFLLDVSASMKQKGRLEILKLTVNDLFELLRPGDRVSIVTFASRSEIVFENVSGSDKKTLHQGIQDVYAEGMTNSVAGFKMAYDLAEEYFIAGANNQVFVVSDGAFGQSDGTHLSDLAAKNSFSGVKTTLLGVRSSAESSLTLNSIAAHGKSHVIQIDYYDEFNNSLIEEIKRNSLKP